MIFQTIFVLQKVFARVLINELLQSKELIKLSIVSSISIYSIFQSFQIFSRIFFFWKNTVRYKNLWSKFWICKVNDSEIFQAEMLALNQTSFSVWNFSTKTMWWDKVWLCEKKKLGDYARWSSQRIPHFK